MKKITMRDVAKATGVSIATVSYVLNNNDKESIPEDTKKKVIDAAEELKYIPNLAARALTRKKSGLIGVFIMSSQGDTLPWRKCFYTEFINILIKTMFDLGYHAIIEYLDPSKDKLDIIYERALDGVFLIDISEEDIYATTSIFKVPIVLVDSFIQDTMFHKIISDYTFVINECKKLLKEDNPIIVVDSLSTKYLIEKCCTEVEFDNLYVANNKDKLVRLLIQNKERKFIVFNEFLALLLRDFLSKDNTAVVCSAGNEYLLDKYKYKLSFDNKKKAVLASDIMMDYINKNYHSNKVSFISPEKI